MGDLHPQAIRDLAAEHAENGRWFPILMDMESIEIDNHRKFLEGWIKARDIAVFDHVIFLSGPCITKADASVFSVDSWRDLRHFKMVRKCGVKFKYNSEYKKLNNLLALEEIGT